MVCWIERSWLNPSFLIHAYCHSFTIQNIFQGASVSVTPGPMSNGGSVDIRKPTIYHTHLTITFTLPSPPPPFWATIISSDLTFMLDAEGYHLYSGTKVEKERERVEGSGFIYKYIHLFIHPIPQSFHSSMNGQITCGYVEYLPNTPTTYCTLQRPRRVKNVDPPWIEAHHLIIRSMRVK